MPRHLCLSATLLTGRYHADEWPPSPARAFQALLAGVMTGGYRIHRARAEEALRWLETLPGPEILAAPLYPEQQSYRLAVPNNDFDVIAREWAKGRPADSAKLRTLKSVTPKLLKESEPHVHYLWDVTGQPEAETERHAATLKTVACCLHTLGWGIDMAFADAALIGDPAALPGERWTRGNRGELLAVPVPGFLDDLIECYQRFRKRTHGAGVDPDTHPRNIGMERYRRAGEVQRHFAAFRLLRIDNERPYFRGAHESMRVAAWLRHAAAEALRHEVDRKTLDEYVLGHVEEGDRSHRLSFVPLPSVGHAHVDGRIRRVLIAEPPGAEGNIAELLSHFLAGVGLVPEGATEAVCALAPAPRDPVVGTYTGSSDRWVSMTPVVLHGFNMQRKQLSLRKTERLLLEAFTESGYPAELIRSLTFQPAPFVAGSIAARDVLLPKHLSQWPRYHVAVEFTRRMSGPVLAGIGRHYGIGLFCPAR